MNNDERVTTLIFDGRQVTGPTACRDYLASYEVSGEMENGLFFTAI